MLMARTAAALIALALIAVAGCGGDDSGGSDGPRSARETFSDTCGGCHTLAAADTDGSLGPNLDDLKPDRQRVLNAIKTGPSVMPAKLLAGDDAQKVADFVSLNAGK